MQIGFFACVQYFNLRVTYLTPRLNYNNFLKFNMVTAILDFQNLISELSIFHLGTKFGSKMLIDAEIMGQNRNPKWRPSAILDFRKPDF